MPARERSIGRVGERQRELELGDGPAKHVEGDRPALLHGGKQLPKALRYSGTSFRRRSTSARMSSLSPGKSKPGHFDALGRRNERLRDEQVRLVRKRETFGGRETGSPALLSNGSPESEAKREFHIRVGKKAVLMTIGVRR